MYTSFFGFRCKPFRLTPDPEFLFMSRVHKRALTYLNYGVRDNYGFILLTGQIGTGKTTIIRTLLKQIPEEIKVARITNTKVSSEQLISMINEDFGIDTRNKDKTQMLSDLTDFLINGYAAGDKAVLIIDEAQNLTPDLLEEVRLLSNLETDKANLLQIILIGQPELNVTLSRPELEQLRQRIAINAYISHLGREETERYIRHRLKIAGNEDGVIFEDGVMDVIFDFSRGVPRLINIICEFALLAAFTDEKNLIDLELMKEIIGDFINERPETRAVSSNVQFFRSQNDGNGKDILKGIDRRLRDLEATLLEIRNRIDPDENRNHLIVMRESELNKMGEELLRKESALLEKEGDLRRREEYIRSMFEQNMKKLSSERSPGFE
jgi:general secretion pathway protein A